MKGDKCSFCGSKAEPAVFSHSYDNYGPKMILLQNIPGKKCNGCGAETVSIEVANQGTEFLRKVEKGLVNTTEKDGIIIARFPAD